MHGVATGRELSRSRRWAWAVLVALLVWTGASVPGLADLRIVSQEDGSRHELLLKERWVSSAQPDGSRFMIDCAAEEIIFVSPPAGGTYWRGSVEDLEREMEEFVQSALGAIQDGPAVPGLDLEALFGSSSQSVTVQVNRVGTGAVAGYDAVHYEVRYQEQGADWQTYEDLWISSALLREVKSEVGTCVNIALDMTQALTALSPMGMGAAGEVTSDPAYVALFDEGFPVRTHTRVRAFGMMNLEMTSEVVEVNRNPIDDDAFTVPTDYRRVDTVIELFAP